MEYLPLALYWVVFKQELLFQEFKVLQDVDVNESQKDAEHWICTQWNLCEEEMLEEKTELISQGKDSVL